MKLKNTKALSLSGAALFGGLVFFFGGFTYNEAGYQTHIRTLGGTEKVATEIGYHWKGFGKATAWKQAQTVQFVTGNQDDEGGDSSAIRDYKIVFLGNVDGVVEASTRFRLPQGDQFLKIAQEYRTPDNFVATALTPAIKETLQSTASLMSADDYFAGARSEFGTEFENQLRYGQYITERKEVVRKTSRNRNEGESLTSGSGLEDDIKRTEFVTEKKVGKDGKPLRKEQQFILAGVDVVEARITNIDPNPQYKQRMQKVQQALADLAIARQDRLKEEEQKLLVTARGEKEVEEKRQLTLKDQIEQTTKAQTAKQLAIITAEQARESAVIQKQTSEELLEKARIDAKAIMTTADALAYEKRKLLEADGALQVKLDAAVKINEAWANAAAKAAVPTTVFGSNGGVSRNGEINDFMSIMTANAAKQLNLDTKIK